MVHRDLKPSNIMLVPDELVPDRIRVKILDFGIAKVAAANQSESEHTQTGVCMGTPRYMAPEQYGKAKEVDGKADVFALGALTYEMLTGQSPFGESSSLVALAKPPARLRSRNHRVSPALDELVARMLSLQPTDRPSMQEVVDGMEQLQGRSTLLMRLWPASVLVVGVVLSGAVWIVLTQPPSLTKLQRKHSEVRERASQVLRDALLSSQPSEVRAVAALELGQTHAPAYREWLIPLLKDADLQVAGAAVDALGELGDDQAGPALRELLDNGPKELSIRVALALALLRPANVSQPGRDYLHKQLDRALQLARPEMANLQARIAAQLYRVGDKTYAGQLLGWLGQPELPISLGARLTYLEQLVDSAEQGEQARHQLQALARQPDEDERLAVTASLQRLGLADAAARTQLTETAQRPGQHQTMAAWLLSRNGDDRFCGRFGELVRDAAQDVRMRQMAADALSRCGFDKAQVLLPLLDKLNGSSAPELRKLRVIYAGALLRIVGPPTARSAESQRNLVDALLRGGRPADYLDAIAILEAQPDDLSVELLGQVLINPQAEIEVRKAAARALGKKQLRAALNVLGLALQDANADVRETGMRAILQLMQELNQPERSGLSGSELGLLRHLVETSTDERELVVIRLLLLRYGERGQLAPLLLLMSRPDREDLRLLIVELASPDSELVRMALRDPSIKVRFFAARRRVEAGGRDAIPVLQEMLARRGEEALLSYWMLRRLGELVKAPTHLSDLLGRGAELYTRIEVVRVLGQLPLEVALPLLLQACSDPASMVRREVAISAWTLYGKSHDPRLIDLLDSLLSDAEAVVRLKAQAILSALLPATAPLLARTVTAADMASAPPPSPEKTNREAVTPLQVDAPPAPTPDASAPSAADGALPPGPEPVLPPPRAHSPVRPPAPLTPAQLGQAWLAESHSLVARGDKEQALAVLSKALSELKDESAKPIYARISWERGEILANRGQLGAALEDYNRVWNRYHGAPPAPMASIEQKFEQLKAKVGRLDIYIKKQNDCVCDSSLLILGGTPLAFTYKGRIRVDAKILAGRVQQKGECTPAAK